MVEFSIVQKQMLIGNRDLVQTLVEVPFKKRHHTPPSNRDLEHHPSIMKYLTGVNPQDPLHQIATKIDFLLQIKLHMVDKYTSPKLFKTRFGSSSPYYIPYTSTSPHYNPPKTTGSTASYPSNKRAYSRTPPIHTSSAYGFHYQKNTILSTCDLPTSNTKIHPSFIYCTVLAQALSILLLGIPFYKM
ncbi:unnamed protein product [Lepeophtheirus salmonis]|uniref:(salmon louse) hypothetical protein n=1 Tax=Lepeophtheirus salmonis TaxID=72036 RepID=A0A7R8D328_LEPSM|nr:unnamed protein product [Lepeophtheirus salmonis]CAF3012526.1 unnamed protein product [Lepeophtheirus salmonis]